MKVADLLEKLKVMPPDAEVEIDNGAGKSVEGVIYLPAAKVVILEIKRPF